MRALLSALAAAGFALAGCNASPVRAVQEPPAVQQGSVPKKLGDAYPLERIIVTSLKDAHLEQLSEKPVPVPADLARQLANHLKYGVRIEDPAGFARAILAELAKRGIPEKDIPSLAPRRLIELSYTIVCDRLEYHLVDSDKDFKDAKGDVRHDDYYFMRGKGDCDKYRDLTIATYNILKARNPSVANLHLGDDKLGGEDFAHAWPTAILLFPDKVEIAHFDPTFLDTGGSIEAKDGLHYRPERFHARVFYTLDDYARARACLTTALAKTAKPGERALLYRDRAHSEWISKDCDAVLRTRREFESEKLKDFHDAVLYYVAETLWRAGRKDESWKVKQELVEKYPGSKWIRYLTP